MSFFDWKGFEIGTYNPCWLTDSDDGGHVKIGREEDLIGVYGVYGKL